MDSRSGPEAKSEGVLGILPGKWQSQKEVPRGPWGRWQMNSYQKVTLRPPETRSLKARQGEVSRGDAGTAVGMSQAG